MFEISDYIIFIVFIIIGLVGGVFNLKHSLNEKYKAEKWYILFKSIAGFYIAIIYALIWIPDLFDNPWITRQCVRGIVFVAGSFWIIDAIIRKHRGCYHG